MVFYANIAFVLGLIALGLGAFIILRTSAESCKKCAKIIGYIVVVGAILSLICTGINAVKRYKTSSVMKRGGYHQYPVTRTLPMHQMPKSKATKAK